ncbi:hypothetical protein BC936DRAFT_142429 [Jimgerdemannia flammicorona]|uniref:Uncharacterized protein n=1 Tax=Jimgerdemannia flammicorona TaxID=994334 RepID=A0A433DF79_9FUNG|nr:hypothetical protein BC936DRAFT_142429 [Jimgerdemannia flammicorona]
MAILICLTILWSFPSGSIAARVQKSKSSDTIVELTHILGKSKVARSYARGESLDLQGGITIAGPSSRLADLHQVTSSWTLVGCNASDQGSQVVFAYCAEAEAANCSGIFIGGAKDTIVKLPDGCGRSPFVHVVSFVPKSSEQFPSFLTKKIGKKTVSVYEFKFDYDFEAIPYNESKEVPTTILMEFSNVAGYIDNTDFGKERSHDAWLTSIKSNSHAHNILIAKGTKSGSISEPFSLKLATLSKQCHDFKMSLSIDAKGYASIIFKIDFQQAALVESASFLIKVISFTEFGGELDAQATLSLDGLVQYTSPMLTIPIIPKTTLPGLNYPYLLAIGPYFKMDSNLMGTITLDGYLHLPTTDPEDPQLTSQGKNIANVTLSDKLELGAKLTQTLEPQLGIGVDVFGGSVKADLALMLSAGLTARGNSNFKPSSGKVTHTCVGVDGDVKLDWGVEVLQLNLQKGEARNHARREPREWLRAAAKCALPVPQSIPQEIKCLIYSQISNTNNGSRDY